MRKIFLLFLFIFCPAACLPFPCEAGMPEGFVHVPDVLPDAILDVRYYGENNFLGAQAEGYHAPTAILTKPAAEALRRAATSLAEQGYALKIFDAYRPERAVRHFVRWTEDAGDQKNKARFYPSVDKKDLIRLGYIARRSTHSRGSAVDVTLVHIATGEEIDMGSPFDLFNEISHHGTKRISPAQAANRKILRGAMEAAGFKAIRTEWWHYVLKDEPFPDRHFDFPIDFYDGRGFSAPLLHRLRALETSDKAIVVLGEKNSARATLYACQKIEGKWAEKFRAEAHTGARGIALPRAEGSLTTPAGVYGLGPAFGVADDPGSILPYTKLRPGDRWVDDPKSKHYNRFVRADFSDRDWVSAEDLHSETVAYKYALVIRYNTGPVVPGAGSAIFLHCSHGRPTAGCVSVPEEAMKKILAFADEDARILIAESAVRLLSF